MAANEQKGFIVYFDSYDMISMLSQEQKGALLDAMFSVYGCCERPEMDQATAITFVTIERYLKDNREKWLEKQEQWEDGKTTRSEQAKKAAHARWEKHREQCSDMPGDADLCSSNADACSSMPEQCSDMPGDAIVTSKQLSVNSNYNNTIVRSKTDDPAVECSADAEPVCDVAESQSAKPKQPSIREVNAHFEQLWALVPRKEGKAKVKEAARRRLLGVSVQDMERCIERYKAQVMEDRQGGFERKWMLGSTWFNEERWKDYTDENYSVPEPLPEVRNKTSRTARNRYQSAEGFRDFSDMEE